MGLQVIVASKHLAMAKSYSQLFNLVVLCNQSGVVIFKPIYPIAYEGDTCSEDKNGCAEVDCFGEIQCLDVPAPGVGAECGPCPSGFTGSGVKCAGMLLNGLMHNHCICSTCM